MLSGTAELVLPDELNKGPSGPSVIRRSIMSHTLKRMQPARIEDLHVILPNELQIYWSDQLPTLMKGWERHEALKKRTSRSRVAFMAMRFGDETLNEVVSEPVPR